MTTIFRLKPECNHCILQELIYLLFTYTSQLPAKTVLRPTRQVGSERNYGKTGAPGLETTTCTKLYYTLVLFARVPRTRVTLLWTMHTNGAYHVLRCQNCSSTFYAWTFLIDYNISVPRRLRKKRPKSHRTVSLSEINLSSPYSLSTKKNETKTNKSTRCNLKLQAKLLT